MTASATSERAEVTSAARRALSTATRLGDEATRSFPVPGGVVVVADRDGVLAEGAFGVADRERGVAMNPGGRFEIGSISKFFTALCVNQLVDEGRLRLEETVGEVLSWAELSPEVQSVTMTELLTHTSGLPAGADALADDAAEIWHTRNLGHTLSSRRHFHYSNIGYQLLGEVVRARTGRRVSEVVRERWLAPLGMRDALGDVTYADQSSMVPGYWPSSPTRPWAPGDALSPATFLETDSASGNVVATGADMARLVMAIIGASRGDPLTGDGGEPVLSRATFERLTGTLAPTGEPTVVLEGMVPVETSRYAMGINVERVEGHACVSHGGGMVGYSTFFLVDCTSGLGVVVLTNANGDSLAAQLLARATHATLLRELAHDERPLELSMDLTVRGPLGVTDGDVRAGTFRAEVDATVMEVRDEGPGEAVTVRVDGRDGRLYRLPTGRFVSDHPSLRRFHLERSSDAGVGWIYGEQYFVPTSSASERTTRASTSAHPLVGHYRCYSPWYPEFRILERRGVLWLSAPGGVEAPQEDEELVVVADGVYRIGHDPALPERLVCGATRDGETLSVARDGCWYSRVFSP